MQPKVSIIIPVYNAKQFIQPCLSNCINQTLEDIEIIVVDDKSTDNTVELTKEVVQQDDRIKLIELDKNYRQGYARNVAVEQAQADYIMYLDVDDAYTNDCVEEMYKKITADGADMTVCKFSTLDDKTGAINQNQQDLQLYKNFAYVDEKFYNGFNYKDLKNEELFDKCNVIWDKIYKKSFLIDNNIKFPGGMFCEDDVYSFTTLFKAEKISVLNKNLIYYRINRADSSSNLQDRTTFDCFKMYEMVKDVLLDLKLYYKYKDNFVVYQTYSFLFFYKYVNPIYKKEFFEKMQKALSVHESYLEDKFNKTKDEHFYTTLEMILRNNYYMYEIKSSLRDMLHKKEKKKAAKTN